MSRQERITAALERMHEREAHVNWCLCLLMMRRHGKAKK